LFCLHQCSLTFSGSRHPVRLKKIWRHPYLAKMIIWGTLSSKKTLKSSEFNIWRHPWHLSTAPLCAAAPRLGINHWSTSIAVPLSSVLLDTNNAINIVLIVKQTGNQWASTCIQHPEMYSSLAFITMWNF